MAEQQQPKKLELAGVPHWLMSGGINALLIILLGCGVAGVLYVLNISASISVPLILAFVIAIISHPLMLLGDRIHMPRPLSAIIVILIVIGIVWASVQITVVGVINQAPDIGTQLFSGLKGLGNWLAHLLEGWGVSEADINTGINSLLHSSKSAASVDATTTVSTATSLIKTSSLDGAVISKITGFLMNGVANITGILSSISNFAFSAFIGAMLLYYLLTDYENVMNWIGDHLGVKKSLGEGLIQDASDALRGYFKGTTITAIVVALGIGLGLWILKVPLVIPIMIVTFLTAYIPFFGAIISSVFACLIALGSGGLTSAVITLIIVLLAQNVLQSMVNAKFMGDSLNLHPIVVLAITIVGSIFGGLLGTMLAAPALAMVLRARRRLINARQTE